MGGSEHWVAVSPDRDPEPVRRFGCFTADLHEMGQWLVQKGVRSVAARKDNNAVTPIWPRVTDKREKSIARTKLDAEIDNNHNGPRNRVGPLKLKESSSAVRQRI